MFSEQKKKNEDAKKVKNGNLIFDELEAKTKQLKVSEDTKKEQKYRTADDGIPTGKKKSIKKKDQKASSTSLNISKNVANEAPISSQRSNSVETAKEDGAITGNMGLGIFEAASMMCNIVDITTDSTSKTPKNPMKKQLKSKDSKVSLNSLASGPFSQMKEAQEQKKKSKQSFDQDDDDAEAS